MVLRVSLLGELSITGDPDPGTGTVRPQRVRSARAVALVTAGEILASCQGSSP